MTKTQLDRQVAEQLEAGEVDDFKSMLLRQNVEAQVAAPAAPAPAPAKKSEDVTLGELHKLAEMTGQNILVLSAFAKEGDLKPSKAIIVVSGIRDTELVLAAVNEIRPAQQKAADAATEKVVAPRLAAKKKVR